MMPSTTQFHSAPKRHPHSIGAFLHGNRLSRLQRFFTLPVVWHERSRHRRHLQMLDERLMRDAGLTRLDIELEASKWFWEP